MVKGGLTSACSRDYLSNVQLYYSCTVHVMDIPVEEIDTCRSTSLHIPVGTYLDLVGIIVQLIRHSS